VWRALLMTLFVCVVLHSNVFAVGIVYEGFNYTPTNSQSAGVLAGKDGGKGWNGAWIDGTAAAGGDAFVYDQNGNLDSLYYTTIPGDTPNGLGPSWDGVVTNLPYIGGYSGVSPWSEVGLNRQYPDSYRQLAQSADAMAGPDNTLWVSAVVHFPNNGSLTVPGIAFTDGGYLYGRAEGLSYSAPTVGDAIGIGNGPTRWPAGQLCPLVYEAGSGYAQGGPSLSTTEDNIIVLKFVFGAVDTVYAWAFTESEALDETVFNANAVWTNGVVNETNLTTFSYSLAFPENAFDEIRIGDSFDEVVGRVDSGLTDAESSSLSASPVAVPADGATPATITVSLRDDFGLPVTNNTVSLSGDGTAIITPNSSSTDSNGNITFDVVSSTPGVENFTATDTSDSVVVSQAVSVVFQSGTDADNSTVIASKDVVVADGASTATVSVSLRDSLDNPVADHTVSLAGVPGSATISPMGVQTSDANGQVSFDVSSISRGTVVFTATDTSDSVVITQSVSISFIEGDWPELLVYEPFDYTPTNSQAGGALAGKDGGIGFGGIWLDGTAGIGGEAFVYDSNGNDTNLYYNSVPGDLPNVTGPTWDGITTNVPRAGGYAGLSPWSNNGANQQYTGSYRPLAHSAGQLAGADNILLLSAIVHFPNNGFNNVPGIALTDGGYLINRAESLTTGDAIGIVGGTWFGGAVGDVCPVVINNRSGVAQASGNLSTTEDNLIVLKFEFGATDSIYAYSFTESSTLDESNFDANAVLAEGVIDENTLTHFCFVTSYPQNAIDEIRMGSTFADVIGIEASPRGTLLILK
jgi:hypothetical protein